MKKQKLIKHTGIFQSIMEKYKENTNQILAKRRANIFNYYLLKDLNQVKNKDNFSDAEYFLNEIRFENKLKSKIVENGYNLDKIKKFANDKVSNNKITKDLFFYYKNQIVGINKNSKAKKNNDLNNKERIKSPKSIRSFSSAKRSYKSYRNSSNIALSLPFIYSNSKKYRTPYKNHFKTIVDEDDNDINIKSEKNERIKYSGRTRIPKYLNYERNYFNNIREDILLKKMNHYPRNLLWKIKLPFVSNKIFNKIDEVNGISKNISRNINHLSNEGNKTIENEKNRIKFMSGLID